MGTDAQGAIAVSQGTATMGTAALWEHAAGVIQNVQQEKYVGAIHARLRVQNAQMAQLQGSVQLVSPNSAIMGMMYLHAQHAAAQLA
jgi:hypothetical protein